MVALIALITIAEVLEANRAVGANSPDEDTIARLNLARRIPR
jgi:hypothetical protein